MDVSRTLTKGTIEADIAGAVVRFQREQQGRGASDVRAHLIGDLVLVRCSGIFTPIEARLLTSDEGRRLIRSSRMELRSINRGQIEDVLAQLVGCPVVRSFYDVDAGEQVEVYVLALDVERRRLRQEVERLGGVAAAPRTGGNKPGTERL